MSRPLVGLTGRRKTGAQVDGFPAIMDGHGIDVYVADYASAVIEAGGIPVHLPIDVDPSHVVDRLDAVLLSGGADIDPSRYGAASETDLYPPEVERDVFELALFERVRELQRPVLAICRGIQLVNIAAGGTLHQHVPEHSHYDVAASTEIHPVALAAGSTLHRLYGDTHAVNSLHHQTIDAVGQGYSVTATAPDGAIEGLESDDGAVLAVQWHPEMMNGRASDPVFRWLVEAAS